MDRYRRIHLTAIAAGFARVVANPAMCCRQRVVGDQRLPRLAEFAGLCVRQPALDIFPGRTGVVAGRPKVGPHRMPGAERPGAAIERQIDDRREIVRSHVGRASLFSWSRTEHTAMSICLALMALVVGIGYRGLL